MLAFTMTIHDNIKSVIAGQAPPETLGPYWRFDIALPVYVMTCRLLDTPQERRAAITATMPPRILELCREEAKRLITHRK